MRGQNKGTRRRRIVSVNYERQYGDFDVLECGHELPIEYDYSLWVSHGQRTPTTGIKFRYCYYCQTDDRNKARRETA
jgi:hypothetical protein